MNDKPLILNDIPGNSELIIIPHTIPSQIIRTKTFSVGPLLGGVRRGGGGPRRRDQGRVTSPPIRENPPSPGFRFPLPMLHYIMITQKHLKKLLLYDPVSGIFTWKLDKRPELKGSKAGYAWKQKGKTYIAIKIDGVKHRAHRLAFLYVYGHIPDLIDHKDGDGTNNSMNNLREATPSQSTANSRLSSNSTSGLKGAHYDKRRRIWKGEIGIDNKTKCLGCFNTAEEAHEAYRKAAIDYFGDFARFV
jgi:hypothetical protein